jgi:hypothetical protein
VAFAFSKEKMDVEATGLDAITLNRVPIELSEAIKTMLDALCAAAYRLTKAESEIDASHVEAAICPAAHAAAAGREV